MRWVRGLNDIPLLAWSEQGETVESIEQSYLADAIVPLPPFDEQPVIVTFLDGETAKIDALIAGQEKLTTLLDERLRATIAPRSSAPRPSIRESGVAWLGEVLEH